MTSHQASKQETSISLSFRVQWSLIAPQHQIVPLAPTDDKTRA